MPGVAYCSTVARSGRLSIPLCAGCGVPIGAYELFWVEHANGRVAESSLLALRDEERGSVRRMYHAGCLAPDAPP